MQECKLLIPWTLLKEAGLIVLTLKTVPTSPVSPLYSTNGSSIAHSFCMWPFVLMPTAIWIFYNHFPGGVQALPATRFSQLLSQDILCMKPFHGSSHRVQAGSIEMSQTLLTTTGVHFLHYNQMFFMMVNCRPDQISIKL